MKSSGNAEMESVTFSLWRVVKLLTAALLIVVLVCALAVVAAVLFKTVSRNQPSAPQTTVSANYAPAPSYAPPVLVYQPPPEQVLAADTRMIPEKHFWSLPFTLSRPSAVTVHVSLKGGVPAIDSYILDEQGFNAWEAAAQTGQTGGTFTYMPSLSMAPLVGDYTRTGTLGAGSYTLVIDNSNLGAARPPFHFFGHDDALVEYRLSVR
jgi:hypothetical protein